MKTVFNPLTRIPPLFNDLAKILEGEIDCTEETLTRNSSDGSLYLIRPQAVIYPKNATDIKHVLSFAREYKMPITVRGNGKSHHGGALGDGIVIVMTRYFNNTRNVNMLENTITVDAGISVVSLLQKLHSWNFDIPFLLATSEEATVGAVVANQTASGSSFHSGTIREWIEGVTIVVDNGEEHKLASGIMPSGRLLAIYQQIFPLLTKENGILRAAKPKSHDDGTGYNLWNTSIGPRQIIDQIIGSEGTLAIITSVTFRISPHKPHATTTCIPIASRSMLPICVDIAKHHKSEHIFFYNETFMQLSERYNKTLAPFFEKTPYTLLVTHTSNDKEKLHQVVKKFRKALPIAEESLASFEDAKTLTTLTDSNYLFFLFGSYTNNTLTPNLIGDGMMVTPHHVPDFLEELEEYLDTQGKLYTITGNIGSGHISLITLFDLKSKGCADEILFYTKNIFSLVKKYSGGISSSEGEGISRTPYLSFSYTEPVLSLFKKIKDIWDPLGILNPGKKIPSTTRRLRETSILSS